MFPRVGPITRVFMVMCPSSVVLVPSVEMTNPVAFLMAPMVMPFAQLLAMTMLSEFARTLCFL